MVEEKGTAESLFELGKLYSERSDFDVAIEKLNGAAQQFRETDDFSGYLRSVNLLLRMYAEMEDFENINRLKESLQDIVLKENVQLNGKTYYSLGLCAAYKGQLDTALDYLEKSLEISLKADSKADICYAISGLAIVYTRQGRFEEALKEIYNLQVFFQVMPLPELKVSSLLMNGHILRKMGKHEQALEIFWQAYDLLREQKNLYMYVSLLYAMGLTYLEAGENDMARMYLSLAKRSADPKNLRRLSRDIGIYLEKIGGVREASYDLVFDPGSSTVTEKKKGKVDFRNQFILMDMLKLFLRHPGEVYSKESLVERIWKQEYDPRVHDNKIYVTIKRLRKMIEPDYDKPKYIFRGKNGYYLNRNTRVLVEQ